MIYYHWVINMSKKICKFCGEDIDRNDIFCKGCGAKIDKDEEIVDAVIEKDKTTKKDTNYLWFLVLLFLIVIIISSSIIIFS